MAHHEPFKALGPVEWETAVENNSDSLGNLLSTTFENAQVLVDSIPSTAAAAASSTLATPAAATSSSGRARSHTDSAVLGGGFDANSVIAGGAKHQTTAAQLRKEWKEIKIKDNPLNISVYKLSAKDGKGSWFSRRSVHHTARDNITFDKWRMALQREFAETLANCEPGTGKEPGTGNIRGIGAERRVERREVEGHGVAELFQVSARFPGPTTPRDFITLLLMPDTSSEPKGKGRKPRQFMLVSKPCEHPDCPPRSGFIRGQYESVEVIREIPVDRPLRRTRSSIDLSREEMVKSTHKSGADSSSVAKEAMLRAARMGVTDLEPFMAAHSAGEEEDEQEMAIEWLMVTRSDPGGSVPRFMVEKGTPGGIVNDASRFIKWLESRSIDDIAAGGHRDADGKAEKHHKEEKASLSVEKPGQAAVPPHHPQEHQRTSSEDSVPLPSGFYGMIASALEAAGSVVVSRMANLTGSAQVTEDEDEIDEDGSDTQSELSYASAEEGESGILDKANNSSTPDLSIRSTRSAVSEASQAVSSTLPATASSAQQQHEKELRKLEEKRRKAQEKIARAQTRQAAKNLSKNNKNGHRHNDDSTPAISSKDAEKEALALARLREKHERELAKQEERYQRDLQRLAEKRLAEEKKAQERKRKAAEREERQNLQRELERTRAERDVALKQIEILRETVGELQAQNTMLVARLGKEGALEGI